MRLVSRSPAFPILRRCRTTVAVRRKSAVSKFWELILARNLDAKCRQCRREGEKLFLKGEKCFTDECAVERRAYPPGQHGQKKNTRLSEYGGEVREKQKVRRIFGMLEHQFRLTFKRADQERGITGETL